jgi:hypothetical protein
MSFSLTLLGKVKELFDRIEDVLTAPLGASADDALVGMVATAAYGLTPVWGEVISQAQFEFFPLVHHSLLAHPIMFAVASFWSTGSPSGHMP